jgi:hypothetical protein
MNSFLNDFFFFSEDTISLVRLTRTVCGFFVFKSSFLWLQFVARFGLLHKAQLNYYTAGTISSIKGQGSQRVGEGPVDDSHQTGQLESLGLEMEATVLEGSE